MHLPLKRANEWVRDQGKVMRTEFPLITVNHRLSSGHDDDAHPSEAARLNLVCATKSS
jgi:hypothetical protein